MKNQKNIFAVDDEPGIRDEIKTLPPRVDGFSAKPSNYVVQRARARSIQKIKTRYEELQNILRLREELSNMVVHDLRCHLTNIILGLELLEYKNNIDESDKELVRNIWLNAKELNSLTENLLLMDKQEAGKLTLNFSDIDALALIEDVKIYMQNFAVKKNMELIIDVPKDFKRKIRIDKDLIMRLLENLITNAIKYSPPRSTIKVRLDNLESEGKLLLQVIDEGEGILKKYHNSIFKKYEIVKIEEKGGPQIGLGLTFCKMVAELHGGKIYMLENKPKGSIFCVEL